MNNEVQVQAVIQARMGSTRLPGKVLLDLAGRSILEHVIRRARSASRVERVVVATSNRPEDEAVAEWCEKSRVPCVCGDADDVLSRFLAALTVWPARHIVRLTADCPLHDPGVIDALIDLHLRGGYDYSSNLHPPMFPHGLDAEVVTREVLETAGRESRIPSHREHVTLFIREHPERFRFGNLTFGRDVSRYRLTIDRPEDLRFLRAFMSRVADKDQILGIYELVRLLEKFPELVEINGSLDRYEWKQKIRESESRDVTLGKTN